MLAYKRTQQAVSCSRNFFAKEVSRMLPTGKTVFKIPLDSGFTFTPKHLKVFIMKKSILMFAALAFGLFACAQTPPKAVADNFAKKFTGATKVKWDQEEANEWEAEFRLNGTEMSASFDNVGAWLETETEISKNSLPETVKTAVSAAYNGWKTDEAESIETPTFKGYEMAIEKGKEELEIQVTASGKITVKK